MTMNHSCATATVAHAAPYYCPVLEITPSGM